MGSGGSTLDVKKRIEEVEKHCEGKKIGSSKDGLEEMKKCAEELKLCMDEVADKSSPDLQLIDRIGIASDVIYSNIESRINLELLQLEDALEVRKAIMEIAGNLDKVRATPISSKVEGRWTEVEQAKYVQILKELSELVKAVSDPAALPEALDHVQSKMDALVGASPETSAKCLAVCAGFAGAKFVKGFPGLLQKEGPGLLEQLRPRLLRFDAGGHGLAKAAEGSWEELEPRVQAVTKQVSSHMAKLQMQHAVAEVTQHRFAESLPHLTQLREWWPLAGDPEVLMESLVKVLAIAEEQALLVGPSVMDFAQELDALRGALGAAGEPLAVRLKGLAALERLRLEVAKGSEVDTLRACLEDVASTPGEGVEEVLASFEDVAVSHSKAGEKEKVLELASYYEETRSKLGLLESTLRQRIEEADPVEPDPGSPAPEHPDPAVDPDPVDPPVAPEAPEEDPEHAVALGKLVEVEEMLAQESGMNPNVILKNLSELVEPWPRLESLTPRLSSVLEALQQRMATACAAASKEDQEQKLKALLAFGQKVHDLQSRMGGAAPEFFFSVCSAGASQDLSDAESELSKESGMNPMVVLKNIRNLKLYWQALGTQAESLHQRLGAMCDLMRSRITTSYEQHEEKRPNLLKFSAAFDAAINGLDGAGEANLTARLKEMG